MGCEMSKRGKDNKMIRVDEEDGTGVDEEHVKTESDAKIDEIKGKKWRPKGRLIVPSGRDSSPSNKIPQLQPSPMHAPQTALDITKNMKTDLGKDSEEERHFAQSPKMGKVFESIKNMAIQSLGDDNDDKNNPLTLEVNDVGEKLDAREIGTGTPGTPGSDMGIPLPIDNLRAPDSEYITGRHFAQSPPPARQFGDYGDPAKTPSGFRYQSGQLKVHTPGGERTPNGFPLRSLQVPPLKESASKQLDEKCDEKVVGKLEEKKEQKI